MNAPLKKYVNRYFCHIGNGFFPNLTQFCTRLFVVRYRISSDFFTTLAFYIFSSLLLHILYFLGNNKKKYYSVYKNKNIVFLLTSFCNKYFKNSYLNENERKIFTKKFTILWPKDNSCQESQSYYACMKTIYC